MGCVCVVYLAMFAYLYMSFVHVLRACHYLGKSHEFIFALFSVRRVVNFLKAWIKRDFKDFKDNEAVVTALRRLVTGVIARGMPNAAKEIAAYMVSPYSAQICHNLYFALS